MNERPIAENVFKDGADPYLIGGKHRATGRLVFPLPEDSASYERCRLPNAGKLWSYTIQRFRPKTPPYIGPEAFEPFALGYVELEGALIVESRITAVEFDQLRIGMPLKLAIVPFCTASDGATLTTFAFKPL
jgi:uncharacterized OB-fold protein